MAFEKHKAELLKMIQDEKRKDRPDRAMIRKLAKRLVRLDEEQDDFIGPSDKKPRTVANPGARNYNYAKWYSD